MSKKRQKLDYGKAVARYVNSLSPAERKDHFTRRKYPSGQGMRGGANRSSTLRREVRKSTTAVTLCLICGGVTPEVYLLTHLFPLCECGPFRL